MAQLTVGKCEVLSECAIGAAMTWVKKTERMKQVIDLNEKLANKSNQVSDSSGRAPCMPKASATIVVPTVTTVRRSLSFNRRTSHRSHAHTIPQQVGRMFQSAAQYSLRTLQVACRSVVFVYSSGPCARHRLRSPPTPPRTLKRPAQYRPRSRPCPPRRSCVPRCRSCC